MGLLSKHRKIPADFREITLLDILNKLEKEHFFNPEQSIQLVKKVDANHLIFSVAQTKVTPAQLHEFKYLEKEKVMSIKSTYQNYFFPSILMYMLPLTAIFFDEGSFAEKWAAYGIIFIGITVFTAFFGFTSLRESSKEIEREIAIRLNYLLREKGYNLKL